MTKFFVSSYWDEPANIFRRDFSGCKDLLAFYSNKDLQPIFASPYEGPIYSNLNNALLSQFCFLLDQYLTPT